MLQWQAILKRQCAEQLPAHAICQAMPAHVYHSCAMEGVQYIPKTRQKGLL